MTTLADELARVRHGDRSAFKRFYDATAPKVLTVARLILRDESRAEDLVQEVFLTVWRRAADYHPERGSPQTWVVSIARNRAIDWQRNAHARLEPLEDSEAIPLPTDVRHSDPRLHDCFEELPTAQRQSIYSAYYLGLTNAELAEHTSTPLGTIKSHLRRGLERLRECLGR